MLESQALNGERREVMCKRGAQRTQICQGEWTVVGAYTDAHCFALLFDAATSRTAMGLLRPASVEMLKGSDKT
ncbi:hypothetical protein [Burkholderia vietnamiensis]|uniref:hypothetical protein n=1 Tax=Burkholderia vietnamiensis TaxID=60552 RepID=UPI0015942BAF|nr:hypothetical protein [Burkholderia vietnamiensis]